jgi:hypothetical protein
VGVASWSAAAESTGLAAVLALLAVGCVPALAARVGFGSLAGRSSSRSTCALETVSAFGIA